MKVDSDGEKEADFTHMKVIDSTGDVKEVAQDVRSLVKPFQKEARRFVRSSIKLLVGEPFVSIVRAILL